MSKTWQIIDEQWMTDDRCKVMAIAEMTFWVGRANNGWSLKFQMPCYFWLYYLSPLHQYRNYQTVGQQLYGNHWPMKPQALSRCLENLTLEVGIEAQTQDSGLRIIVRSQYGYRRHKLKSVVLGISSDVNNINIAYFIYKRS